MSKRFIWKNGKILPESEAKVSIFDSGFQAGHCFEMCRSFNGQHFKSIEHIERLFASMRVLDINVDYSINDIWEACEEVTRKNKFEKDDEHRLYIIASRGLIDIYNCVEGVSSGAYIMISDFPLRWTVSSMAPIFDKGLNLVLTNQKPIPSRILDNRIKHHNRLHSMLANLEVSNVKGKYNWPVFTDENGFLTECPGANIILIKNERFYSPKTNETLDGISRQYVKEICETTDLDFIEKDLLPYDLYNADGCFVCATPFCMLPVTSFNGMKIGSGTRHWLYNDILETWSTLVGVDIERQIKSWYKPSKTGSTPYQIKR
jgi:branched-chain amino acid aminotransferase